MKRALLAGIALLTCASAALPDTVFVTGTPAFNNTGRTPLIGTLVNFDDPTLVAAAAGGSYALPSDYYASIGIASISDPSGVFVEPYSTQSAPNFLTNGNASVNGEANITISFASSVNAVGVGVADADGAPITLELWGAGNTLLSTQTVSLPTNTVNAYNGYFAFIDSTSDIYGLSVIQNTDLSASSPSGLAIDDIQFAPEPATTGVAVLGFVLLGAASLRKRNKA